MKDLIKEAGINDVFQKIGDGIIVVDRLGNIRFLNSKVEEILESKASEIQGKPLYQVLKLENRRNNKKYFGYLDKITKSLETFNFPYPTILIDSKRKEHYVEAKIHPFFKKEKTRDISGFLITISDKTELYKIETQMQKNLRIKSLGKILGGLAHDFNNILTTILGNVSLAKLEVDENTELEGLLTEAEDGIEKARQMTQQLLTFSTEDTKEKELIQFDEILEEMVNFTLSGSNVECEVFFEEELWPAILDKTQISQAIHQIILNGVQAMPIGGKIDITAKNVNIDEDHPLNYHPGHYVNLVFQDQGIGIPEEDLPYIFDPFYKSQFGTRDTDLAIVKNIIEQHHGYIEIESIVGEGTKLSILLPAEAPISVKKKVKLLSEDNFFGKVLIMDDELVIRKVLGKMLNQLGFEAYSAPNGEMAVELYQEHLAMNDPFKIVILDLTIKGGMGGLNTIEELIKIDPNVKAVASSGYSTDKVMTSFDEYGFAGTLVKPYKVEELRDTLSKL